MIDVIVQGVSYILSGKNKPIMKLLGIKANIFFCCNIFNKNIVFKRFHGFEK